MGLFGVGGIGFEMEKKSIEVAMSHIGAWESDTHQKCERCYYWASAKEVGSKYFGGCRYHQIKVLASYVCENYDGRYRG